MAAVSFGFERAWRRERKGVCGEAFQQEDNNLLRAVRDRMATSVQGCACVWVYRGRSRWMRAQKKTTKEDFFVDPWNSF